MYYPHINYLVIIPLNFIKIESQCTLISPKPGSRLGTSALQVPQSEQVESRKEEPQIRSYDLLWP
jgi:hypothetical protein